MFCPVNSTAVAAKFFKSETIQVTSLKHIASNKHSSIGCVFIALIVPKPIALRSVVSQTSY